MRRQFSPVVLTDRSVGGLSYTQPAITAAASYYKIMSGNPITFGWNFTNILCVPVLLLPSYLPLHAPAKSVVESS